MISDDSGDSITIEAYAPLEGSGGHAVVSTVVGADGAPIDDAESIDAAPAAEPVVEAPATVAAAIDQLDPPIANETTVQRTERQTRLEAAIDLIEPPVSGETAIQRLERYQRVASSADRIFRPEGPTRRIALAIADKKAAEERASKAEADLKTAREALARQTTTEPPAPAAAPLTPAHADEPQIPAFDFAEFEDWSELPENANKTHRDYSVALADARHDWRVTKATIEAANAHRLQLKTEWETAVKAANDRRTQHLDTFRKSDHGKDYDAVMATAMDLPLTPAVHTALDDLEDTGPAVAKYLAQHRDEYVEILKLRPSKQAAAVLAVADTLTKAAEPPPAAEAPAAPATAPVPARAAAPSRPLSDAPAPTGVVPGGAQPTRSLAALAAEGEDADPYIARRQADLKAASGRR